MIRDFIFLVHIIKLQLLKLFIHDNWLKIYSIYLLSQLLHKIIKMFKEGSYLIDTKYGILVFI